MRRGWWNCGTRQGPQPEVDPCEKLKERAAARNKALWLASRDIGELPAAVSPERKERAERDFRFFCQAYFPMTFHLRWSADHLKVMAKIEQAVLSGGLFAMAMPRGAGKTVLAESACLWALLYGHREFVCLIGSDEGHAMDMLESIKMELDGNELLLEDFPEVVYPIQCLDGIANRCAGQQSSVWGSKRSTASGGTAVGPTEVRPPYKLAAVLMFGCYTADPIPQIGFGPGGVALPATYWSQHVSNTGLNAGAKGLFWLWSHFVSSTGPTPPP